MQKTHTGIVQAALVMKPDMSPVSTPMQHITLTWEGIQGDKHGGLTIPAGGRSSLYPEDAEIRNSRQLSLVSEEELEEIAERLSVAELQPEWLGANISLSGIPNLTQLAPGTRLHFSQGAALVVESENTACTSPGRVVQEHFPDTSGLASAFPKAALGKRGLVAWVERPGVIEVGDSIQVWTL